MNWNLVARCGARYALCYAGATVAAVSVVTRSGLALVSLFGLGLVAVLLALGGTGTVRMGAAMTNHQATGFRSGIVDPADSTPKRMDNDVKLLFYGVGLLSFSALALVLRG
ncbi:hypothetical protein [Haladaptatus salinisoli]|uniref:hypothetical protein n=1 Tax=Haladaptatus salinisoli TaxID=2884876 RepID=UPI001D0AC50C|nr:hypothetical protein [Haladaptatus salinisoli]